MSDHADPRCQYREGQRVRLLAMPNDPAPQDTGAEGTVVFSTFLDWPTPYEQVHIMWDNGRTISCVVPPDELQVID